MSLSPTTTMAHNRPPHPPSLLAEILHEGQGLFHSHTLRSLRAVLLKQGFPSPGLFIIVSGEVLVQKELELVQQVGGRNHASSQSSQSNGKTDHSQPDVSLHRKTIKPVEVALIGAGDYFGDIGLFEGPIIHSNSSTSATSEGKRSPVTVLSNTAHLEVQFIRRVDLLRTFSKPLLRALRAHAQAKTATHASRVAKVMEALGAGVAGRVRDKSADPNANILAQALETFWSNASATMDSVGPTTFLLNEGVGGIIQSTESSQPPTHHRQPTASRSLNATPLTIAMTAAMTGQPSPSPFAFQSTPTSTPLSPNSLRPVMSPMAPIGSTSTPAASTTTTKKTPASATTSTGLSKQALEERRLQKEKEQEAFQESLNKRYQNMKLKAQKMFFPDSLLQKMRARVFADSQQAQGGTGQIRLTKALGQLLTATAGNGRNLDGTLNTGVSGDPSHIASERETKDMVKFYSEALKSAETKKAMTVSSIASIQSDRSHVMAALLQNETRNAQARFEQEQMNKLGALDTLLREERLRQQKEREIVLGNESENRKRAAIPSAHFNSKITPVVGMRMSLSSILSAHGPKPLRGVEALLERSKLERQREEEEMRQMHLQLERSLQLNQAMESGPPGSTRPATAPEMAPIRNQFILNQGLDTAFLTKQSLQHIKEEKDAMKEESNDYSGTARSGSVLGHRRHPHPPSTSPHFRSSSSHGHHHGRASPFDDPTSPLPTYYESLHRLAESPPTPGSKLLSSVYAPDSFRASNLELVIARAQQTAERFGRDMETLPPPPPKPSEWKEEDEDELGISEAEKFYAVPTVSDTSKIAHIKQQQAEIMGDLLSSPAPLKLHSAAMPSSKRGGKKGIAGSASPPTSSSMNSVPTSPVFAAHAYASSASSTGAIDLDSNHRPRAFSDTFHSFSKAMKMKAPGGVRHLGEAALTERKEKDHASDEEKSASTSKKKKKEFYPRAQLHTPLILLQQFPSILDTDEMLRDTPQGILHRQQREREKAEAERRVEEEKKRELRKKQRMLEEGGEMDDDDDNHDEKDETESVYDADYLYELERQERVQAFANSLDQAANSPRPLPDSRRVSMDKYQPIPISPSLTPLTPALTHTKQDDFLVGNFRVAEWKRPVLTVKKTKLGHKRMFSGAPVAGNHRRMTTKLTLSATGEPSISESKEDSTKTIEVGVPAHARAFTQQAIEKLNQAREHEAELQRFRQKALEYEQQLQQQQSQATLLVPGAGLSSLSEGHESATSSHAMLPSFSNTTLLPLSNRSSTSALNHRASTAPATNLTNIDGTASPRRSRSPRPPLDAPKSPRAPVRQLPQLQPSPPSSNESQALVVAVSQPPPPPPAASQALTTLPCQSPRVKKLKYTALLADPSLARVRSSGRTRPTKVGSPSRRVSRLIESDDPSLLISPLTPNLVTTVRTALLLAIEERAEELAEEEYRKREAKRLAPPPKHTDEIRTTTAALHVINKRPPTPDPNSTENEVEDTVQPSPSIFGDSIIMSTPRLNILESLPPERKEMEEAKPTIDAANKVAHTSGTEAASVGRLASSITPLSSVLKANNLSSMLSGLTAVSQMLPSNTSARKLAELYAHFQRHLARSREYFLSRAESEEKRRQEEAKERERMEEEKRKNPFATPTPTTTSTLHRVDSTGFIHGPDRIVHSLASSFVPTNGATATVMTAASKEEKLSGRYGARRRGGGYLGMLENQTSEEMKESITVLADMIAKDSLENEQALRVLNSYDKKQLLYLPTTLLQRAQELHALLDRKLQAEAEARENLIAGPQVEQAAKSPSSATQTKLEKSLAELKEQEDDAIDEDDEDEDEESEERRVKTDADRLAKARVIARRKAKMKFRMLPGVVVLFPDKSKNNKVNGSKQASKKVLPLADADATQIDESRLVDVESARRVVSAVSAANRCRTPGTRSQATTPRARFRSRSAHPHPHPPSASRAKSAHPYHRTGIPSARHANDADPRITEAPLPPSFMSLYESYGLRPRSASAGSSRHDAIGFETMSDIREASPAPSVSLVDVVRTRANLERKLKQDEFVSNMTNGSSSDGTRSRSTSPRKRPVSGQLQSLDIRNESTTPGPPDTPILPRAAISGARFHQRSVSGGMSPTSPSITTSSVSFASGTKPPVSQPTATAAATSGLSRVPDFSVSESELDEEDESLDIDAMLAKMAAARHAASGGGVSITQFPSRPSSTSSQASYPLDASEHSNSSSRASSAYSPRRPKGSAHSITLHEEAANNGQLNEDQEVEEALEEPGDEQHEEN